jgi:hypothetical protein
MPLTFIKAAEDDFDTIIIPMPSIARAIEAAS